MFTLKTKTLPKIRMSRQVDLEELLELEGVRL